MGVSLDYSGSSDFDERRIETNTTPESCVQNSCNTIIKPEKEIAAEFEKAKPTICANCRHVFTIVGNLDYARCSAVKRESYQEITNFVKGTGETKYIPNPAYEKLTAHEPFPYPLCEKINFGNCPLFDEKPKEVEVEVVEPKRGLLSRLFNRKKAVGGGYCCDDNCGL